MEEGSLPTEKKSEQRLFPFVSRKRKGKKI
nr:MAG TPA: hypothetical protein [Caudoviricetes sp.]